MRGYQKKKNTPYRPPHNLYKSMLYTIRDYPRIKAERDNIINATPSRDGGRAGGTSSPTEAKAMKLYALDEKCGAIEKALESVRPEYRNAVFSKICYGSPFPYIAGEATYKRWLSRFVYEVAKNLHEI